MSAASERGSSARNEGQRDLAVAIMASVKKRESVGRGGKVAGSSEVQVE
jgi:hypothetical protein